MQSYIQFYKQVDLFSVIMTSFLRVSLIGAETTIQQKYGKRLSLKLGIWKDYDYDHYEILKIFFFEQYPYLLIKEVCNVGIPNEKRIYKWEKS